MAEQQPNWEDLYRKAKASGDADFEREFADVTKNDKGSNKNTESGPSDKENTAENGAPNENKSTFNQETSSAKQEQVTKLEAEVDEERKDFLGKEYEKRKSYKQILGYFKKTKEDEGRYYEQDQDIAYYRAHYDASLMKLRDAKIAEAKARNASDQEIADIFGSFLVEQNLKVREMHDEVKAENQEGKTWGPIKNTMLEISKGYRNLSFKQKLAVGAAFAGAAAGVTTLGAGIAGATTLGAGILTLRRTLMGMISGVGAAEGLVAKTVRNKEKEIEKQKVAFLEKLAGMNEEEKYELLSKNTWNVAIKDEERALETIKNKNLGSLAAGTAFGVFVGSGLMGDMMGKIGHGGAELLKDTWVGHLTSGAYHKVSDFFTGHHEAAVAKPKVQLRTQQAATPTNAPRGYETYGHDKSEFKIPETEKTVNAGAASSAHDNLANEKNSWSTNAFEHNSQLQAHESGNMSENAFSHAQHEQITEGKTWSSNALEHGQNGSGVKEIAKSAVEKMHPTSLEVKGEMVHGHFKSDSIWKETKGLVEKMHPGASKAEINEYTRNIVDNSVKHYAQEHHLSAGEAMAKLSKIHGAKLDITYSNGVPDVHIHDVKFMHGHVGHHAAVRHHAVPKTELPTEKVVEVTNSEIASPYQVDLDYENGTLGDIQSAINHENAQGLWHTSSSNMAGVMENLSTERAQTLQHIHELVGEEGSFKIGVKGALKEITSNKTIVNKQEFWHKIKDIPFDQANKDLQARKGIQKLLEQYLKVLGSEANPLKDKHETVGKWLSRVVQKTVELKKELPIEVADQKLAA